MNKFKLISGVLLIFLTGVAAGHVGTFFYFQTVAFKQGPPALHHLIKNKISRHLKLTQQQQIKFDEIIAQAEKSFETFRQKHHPELEQNLDECFQKINEILTPEQQKKFKQIQNRFKRKFSGPKKFSQQQGSKKHFIVLSDELIEQLNIDADQLKNIQPIIRQFNRDIKNIFMENQDPLNSLDQNKNRPHDIRNRVNKIRNDMILQIKPYLNQDQIGQFQEIIKNQRTCLPDEKYPDEK